MLLNTDRYLERKIDRFLQVWQETPGHKPLLIKGARQVGKTEAVRHFARGRYTHFHEINFVLREEFKQIVGDGCSVASILRRISLIEPTWRFEAEKTLGKYMASGTFEGTLDLQRTLVNGYRDDIKKYASGMDRTRIRNVYDHIPAQLANENKRFQVSKVAPGARFRDYRGCVEWLNQNLLRANQNFGVYKGALYENIVAEAFANAVLVRVSAAAVVA